MAKLLSVVSLASLALLAGCSDEAPPPSAVTAVERATSLLGVHDPPAEEGDVARTVALFGGRGGWTVNVVYATDFDWVDGDAARVQRLRARGFTPVVRVDYARPDASVYVDGSRALGATVPPPGDVGYCLGRGDLAPGTPLPAYRQRNGGTHLACYLRYLDDLVARASAVHTWVIGNEMNTDLEARGFAGGCIAPRWYAEVFRAARQRIRAVAGHGNDAVFVGGVAPGPSDYVGDARVEGCPTGTRPLRRGVATPARYLGAKEYLQGLLYALQPAEADGVALHAYGGWPRTSDNGGTPALTLFEEGVADARDPTFGYRSAARWIDLLGWSRTPLLITEMSVHTHADHSDRADTAAFIRAAYTRLDTWNRASGNHAVVGAAWFTFDNPRDFSEESLARLDEGPTEDVNPVATFRALAGSLGPGDPSRVGNCAAPAGQILDRSNLDTVTNAHLAGPFGDFWRTNGGLAVFGRPLEEAACRVDAATGRVLYTQVTERQRFEFHPEFGDGSYDRVQLGLLGRAVAERQGVDTRWSSRRPGETRADCAWMGPSDAFGHWVCGPILARWRAVGLDRGLADRRNSLLLWGYPITDERPATQAGTTLRSVQWFERARLERHANAPPYDVLGGRLGAELIGR